MKLRYRHKLLSHVVNKADQSTTPEQLQKSVDVLRAIHWLSEAIKEVKPSTVEKCFVRARVRLPGDPESFSEDDEDDIPPGPDA